MLEEMGMTIPVSRREFLKYSLATGALVVAGDATTESALAQPTTGLVDVDELTVWTLTDN
jgi:hypothetical protein